MKQLRLRVGFWVWAKSYSSRMMTVQNNLFIRAHAITSIYVKSTGSSSSSGKFSPLMQKWLLQGWFFFLSQLFFVYMDIWEKRAENSIQPTKIICLTTGNSVQSVPQEGTLLFGQPTHSAIYQAEFLNNLHIISSIKGKEWRTFLFNFFVTWLATITA